MLRRIFGVVMIGVGISGIILSIAGLRLGHQLVNNIGDGIAHTLMLTSQSLETVEDTLNLTRATMLQVSQGISTTQQTLGNVAVTVGDTRPMLIEVTEVVSQDAPTSIEAVQASLPNVVEVAANIDLTLRTLNDFQFERRILGVPLRFDLGIRYAPEEPFDESIARIGDSLEGLPDRLRLLETYLEATDANLVVISQDMTTLADDMLLINQSVIQVQPLLDDYSRLALETNDAIRQSRSSLAEQIHAARLVITIIFIYIGLSQIAPLYLGLDLLLGSRAKM